MGLIKSQKKTLKKLKSFSLRQIKRRESFSPRQIPKTEILSKDLKMTSRNNNLQWIGEAVLKRFEASHKDFDTLNTRAGAVIGFSGLFNSILIPSWQTLDLQWRFISGYFWIVIVALMLFFAFCAYQVASVESMPIQRHTIDRFLDYDDEDIARLEFISNLTDSCERMSRQIRIKSYYLKISISFFGIQIFASLLLVLLGCMQGNRHN